MRYTATPLACSAATSSWMPWSSKMCVEHWPRACSQLGILFGTLQLAHLCQARLGRVRLDEACNVLRLAVNDAQALSQRCLQGHGPVHGLAHAPWLSHAAHAPACMSRWLTCRTHACSQALSCYQRVVVCTLLVRAATASPRPRKLASRSSESCCVTVQSTSKHTACASLHSARASLAGLVALSAPVETCRQVRTCDPETY